MSEVIREIVSDDGMRKVSIFRREDGTYGFEESRYSTEPNERAWLSFGRYSECFAADAELAESEAWARVGWLASGAGRNAACRQRAARLARALYDKRIPYETFLQSLPVVEDELVRKLEDLITHEPQRGGFLGVSVMEHGKHMARIWDVVERLER